MLVVCLILGPLRCPVIAPTGDGLAFGPSNSYMPYYIPIKHVLFELSRMEEVHMLQMEDVVKILNEKAENGV